MASQDAKEVVTVAMGLLQKAIRQRFAAQGHHMTGATENSVQFEVLAESDDTTIGRMAMSEVGLYLEFGIKANRIPYSGRTGNGGTSEYIQGLIRFFEYRGLSGREATGAAFATATVHKREGLPTRGSSRYSQDGKRTGFIKQAIDESLPEITALIESLYAPKLEIRFKFEYEPVVINL